MANSFSTHRPRVIEARGTLLRPVHQADYPMLRNAEIEASITGAWRFAGQTPSPESYAQLLWNDVLAQFLICDTATAQVQGMVSAYSHVPETGVTSLAVAKFGDPDQVNRVMHGCALFVDWLFHEHALRKIRIETPESNLARLGSLLRLGIAVEEGRFIDERFMAGEYRDLLLWAIWRDTWNDRKRIVLGHQ